MAHNILIVDDSSTIRKIIALCLKHAQVNVNQTFEAANGEEALAVMEKEKIDLVLTDINMPKMNGLELLSKIRSEEKWNGLPVLLISTEGGVDTVVEAAHRGAAGYVRKPFTAIDIRAKVEPLLT